MAERGTGNEQAVALKLLANFELKHPQVLQEPEPEDDSGPRTKNDGLATWRGVNGYGRGRR